MKVFLTYAQSKDQLDRIIQAYKSLSYEEIGFYHNRYYVIFYSGPRNSSVDNFINKCKSELT